MEQKKINKSSFPHASHHYSAEKDCTHYQERTSRNHYWVGGKEGQEAIKNLRVAVAGLGGMGSNIAENARPLRCIPPKSCRP